MTVLGFSAGSFLDIRSALYQSSNIRAIEPAHNILWLIRFSSRQYIFALQLTCKRFLFRPCRGGVASTRYRAALKSEKVQFSNRAHSILWLIKREAEIE